MNKKLFDSTVLDETRGENVKTALSCLSYREIYDVKKELGDKASLHNQFFDNLVDLASMNKNFETRDVRHFKFFKEFRDDFDVERIREFIERLKAEIEHTKNHSERSEKKYIMQLLEKFIDITITC